MTEWQPTQANLKKGLYPSMWTKYKLSTASLQPIIAQSKCAGKALRLEKITKQSNKK